MKTSEAGLDFIRGFESYLRKQEDGSCRSYQCQAGRWTCGWGCTEGVTATTHWTLEEAKDRFAVEMAKHEAAVNNAVKVPISQSQFDALTSFSYNCGTGAVAKLIAPMNRGDMKATAEKFGQYNKYHDPKTKRLTVSRGLTRRRSEEAAMFLKEEGGHMPQAVVAQTKLTVKEAVAKVAVPAAVAVSAVPSLPVPSVPSAVTDSLTNIDGWKTIGGQLWALKDFAVSHPMQSLVVGVPLLILWLWPKPTGEKRP